MCQVFIDFSGFFCIILNWPNKPPAALGLIHLRGAQVKKSLHKYIFLIFHCGYGDDKMTDIIEFNIYLPQKSS